jgi:CheY-like chemotaxis protein
LFHTAKSMPRILVIEDDPAIRAAVELILDNEGYSVTPASDGDAGLALLRAETFDLAIVDIFMPGRSGLETISLIREHAPAMPVVATSGLSARGDGAHPADDVLGQALQRGASCIIHKPFRPRDLLQTVERCLDGGAGA